MGKALFVIAQEDFRDEEFAKPYGILEEAGHEIEVASVNAGPCKGMLGAEAKANVALRDVPKTGWDAVVFVGGSGSSVFFDDEDAHSIAKATVSEGKVLGAICIAPVTLANARLLKGVRATSFPSAEDQMRSGGADWTGNAVETQEVDESGAVIVTANGPQSAALFGDALVKALKRRA